eukprot:5776883-Amphidinium_carterae.1
MPFARLKGNRTQKQCQKQTGDTLNGLRLFTISHAWLVYNVPAPGCSTSIRMEQLASTSSHVQHSHTEHAVLTSPTQ